MGFLTEQCTLKPLSEEILQNCHTFSCGHSDLDYFFYHKALAYHLQLIGKSYCFMLNDDPRTIACFFTISNDSIKTNMLPNSRARMVKKNIPREKHMKTYPAVLIGRLGVNLNLKGKGIGSELMGYLKGWLVDSDNKADCRYLVVDAYNTPDVVAYYLRNAFSFMFSSEEQEKAYLKLSSEDKLETRFMLFDLIVLNIER